ncbi:MAG: hypothetical protein PHU85_11495, partial [Phycisphaerae bacterium]|nr:hypothetical protein [Phycisphaerae bacterium]
TACWTAMRALIDVLRARKLRPLALPGGHEYGATTPLLEIGGVAMVESTYGASLRDNAADAGIAWNRAVGLDAAYDGMGSPGVACCGFYGAGLRDPDFLARLARSGLQSCWWFFRPEDEPDLWPSDGWYGGAT